MLKLKLLRAGFIISICFGCPAAFALEAPPAVKICNDVGEWPPFYFHPRENGVAKQEITQGASIEFMDEIFKRCNLSYEFALMPWARCQQSVAENASFEAISEASYNPERAKLYYFTIPIYSTHVGVFYSKKRFPDISFVKEIKDLKGYKVCGRLGFNYAHIKEVLQEPLDLTSLNIKSVIDKITLKRCDFLAESLETAYGAVATGQFTMPEEISSVFLQDLKRVNYHILVSKKSPRVFELITQINQAIIALQYDGTATRIFKKYLPEYVQD